MQLTEYLGLLASVLVGSGEYFLHYSDQVIDHAANYEFSKIEITTATKKLTEVVVSGEGLASDQTALAHFGLGKEDKIEKLRVTYSNGKVIILEDIMANTLVDVAKEEAKQLAQKDKESETRRNEN